jgi:hypothetical protein
MTPIDILTFFLVYIIWIATFVGLGHMVLVFSRVPEEFSYLIEGFIGMLIVAIAATIYHFFLPLDVVFIFLMVFIGTVGWWGRLKHTEYSPRVTLSCVAVAFAIFAIIPLLWYRYYDTGLYHLQAMRWVLEQPLQLGLANLHPRLGYNSVWFNLESAVDFIVVLKGIPYFLLNGIAVYFYVVPAINILRKKLFASYELFYLLTLIPVVGFAPLFITSASPDFFMMLITFAVFIIFIAEYDFPKQYEHLVFIAVLLAGFAGMVKLFGFILLLFAVWVYFRHYGVKHLLAILIFIPWLIQGIATSGYIAFPLAFSRVPVIWSVPSDIAKFDAANVVAWARMQGADSSLTTLSNNNWVAHWMASPMVAMVLVEILLLTLIALSFRPEIHKLRIVPIAIAIAGTLAWYGAAPEPRYALGFILATPLVVLAYGMDTQLKTGLLKSRKLVEGCFAILAILAIVQGAAIYTYTHTCIDGGQGEGNPVTRPYSESYTCKIPFDFPEPSGAFDVRYGIVIPIESDQMWNSPLPSTPVLDERFYYGRLKWIGMEIPINFMGIMR